MSLYNFIILRKYNLYNLHELSGIEKNKHEIGLRACNFFKKRLQHRCFPVEFVKLSRTVVVPSESTYYYVIKNHVGHKLVIFNTVLLLYCIYFYPDNETWDLEWLWQERTDRRNVCLKQKEALLMLYNIDKNWYHFIKEYLE